MPVRLVLQAVANQSFTTLLDGITYEISLKQAAGVMVATIALDGTNVLSGSRFFADTPLITYEYLEAAGGNFIMQTEADALPDFEQFDVTQFLFYLTAAEVADAR